MQKTWERCNVRATERKMLIMKKIQNEGTADIAELAHIYNVSTMTIRRDLSKLAEEGLVTLEYGGAVLNSGTLFEHNMTMKKSEYQQEKLRIAKKCASLIKEGDSVFLDAGTTVCELANLIAARRNITVMTHSLLVANALASSEIDLIMCPGKFRPKSMAYMGQFTDQFLSSFQIDKLFLAVEGVDVNTGISVPNIQDGVTKQNLIKYSKQVICMTDHSKFDKSFYFKICGMEQIDLLVTDSGLSEEQAEIYAKSVNLVRA